MESKHISGAEFARSVGEAMLAAGRGPVIITDNGRPSRVLMSVEHYNGLRAGRPGIAEMLAMDEDVELELPDFSGEPARAADLS